MRRASVWAAGAYLHAFKDEDPQAAARRALAELAGVNKAELNDDDAAVYTDAAIRVGAVRAGGDRQGTAADREFRRADGHRARLRPRAGGGALVSYRK